MKIYIYGIKDNILPIFHPIKQLLNIFIPYNHTKKIKDPAKIDL